jgi:glycosyltransferase involved in cell wall biosynthesis
LHILVVTSYYLPSSAYGGPLHSVHKRSVAIAQRGHQVTTYTTAADGVVDLEIPPNGLGLVDNLPVHYFRRWWFGRSQKPYEIFLSPEMGKQLRTLRAGDYDLILIHAHWSDVGRMAAGVAQRTGTPYIFYTHGCFEPWAFKHRHWKKIVYLRLIESRILQRAAGIVVCNDAETEQLRRLGILTPIRRIPWGVEIQDQGKMPPRQSVDALFPALSGSPFLLFLSRLHPKKGLDLLVSAFAELAADFPDWVLVLAGPDEDGYRISLERTVARSGIENQVLFTGLVTGKPKAALLAHADLFVLPSYSEGFPMVVAEALGYARPMVITTTCYVPEVAREGAGLVVPLDKGALARALRQMMEDDSLRTNCSQNAFKVAQKYFTWDQVAEQTLAFYREAMELTRASRQI